MRLRDTLGFALSSLTSHRSRTGLTLLAVALGSAAVVLLSALGQGARAYVEDEFTQLGTHLLIIFPGRNETTGGPPPLTQADRQAFASQLDRWLARRR